MSGPAPAATGAEDPRRASDGWAAVEHADDEEQLLPRWPLAPAGAGSDSGPSSSSGRGQELGPYAARVLTGLCALSVVVCYADRSNIATAILPMSQDLGWSHSFQGIVLSAFFAGYLLTQTLGGVLADRLGGKPVLAAGVALWSLWTLLTPPAARAGVGPLLLMRVLLGAGEGVTFPSLHALFSRHISPAAQSFTVAVVTSSIFGGAALASWLAPPLIGAWGWPSAFYVFGALGLLWIPPWLWLAPDAPRGSGGRYRAIDDDGDDDSVAAPAGPTGQNQDQDDRAAASGRTADGTDTSIPITAAAADLSLSLQIPWHLLARREVLAICVAQYGGSWGFYVLLNWLPTYFHQVYGVSVADLGGFTVAPYLVQGGVGVAAGVAADALIRRGFGRRRVRVGLQTVGMLGPAACMLLAASPLAAGSAAAGAAFLTVGLGLGAATMAGVNASNLDIAPHAAGFVYGAGNTAGTLAGLLAVPLTGVLLDRTDSWPLVFSVAVGHYVLCAAVFAAWCGDGLLKDGGGGGAGAGPDPEGGVSRPCGAGAARAHVPAAADLALTPMASFAARREDDRVARAMPRD